MDLENTEYCKLYEGICRSYVICFKTIFSVYKFLAVLHVVPFRFLDLVLCLLFIHSIDMCRMRRFLAILRSFSHSSLLCTFSYHPSPPTILPSFYTSSCHLFLGLTLKLVVPKFFLEFYFLPFSVHAQTNVIYLTLLSLLQ